MCHSKQISCVWVTDKLMLVQEKALDPDGSRQATYLNFINFLMFLKFELLYMRQFTKYIPKISKRSHVLTV